MAVSASRKARIELTASAAGMDGGLRDARRKMRTFERDQARAAKEQERAQRRAMHGAFGLGRSVMHGLAAAAGFDLAGGIGGLASDVIDTEKELTRFQIDAQLSTAQVARFRDELMRTSQETGVSRNALVRGAHAYQILTGDAAGAVQQARLFADVANASGASMEDIAATAASLRQNLGFDPSQFRQGFDVLLTLGHKGSVELRDLASQMANLAPQFALFGQKSQVDKLTEMGAAMQVIRKEFGSTEEMSTGLQALMTAFAKKGGTLGRGHKLSEFGVNVFRIDPKTKQVVRRDFLDIVHDIIKNPALNDKVLPALLGRQEAVRALDALRDHWDEIAQLQAEAANSNQVAKDSQTYMNSTAGKLARAWEHIKNAIANALTPERIDRFADAALKVADTFAQIVGFVDHLMSGGPDNEKQADAENQFIDQLNNGPTTENGTPVDQAHEAMRQFALNPEKFLATAPSNLGMPIQQMIEQFGEGNVRAAAMKLLKSEGTAISAFDITAAGGRHENFVDRSRFSDALGSGELAKAIGKAVGAELARLGVGAQPTTVKVGAEPVVKAYTHAVSQRTRPGGR